MNQGALNSYLRYPIYDRPPTWHERLALRLGTLPIFCPVCGNWSRLTGVDVNFRETCRCRRCGASNRQRQIARVLCHLMSTEARGRLTSLRKLKHRVDCVLYNTETSGPLHKYLSKMPRYISSEYFGPEYKSGDMVNGLMHQDLMHLSLKDSSVDVILSSDVLEHVPDPWAAHQEIFRVLAPGGRHILTVPFYQTSCRNELRAKIAADGSLLHIKPPIFHLDPIRPEGILVYNIFSLEMLVDLERIGFSSAMYCLYCPWNGILGANGLVFEARKPE